ncbi:LysR substrate-binding domain-containing protein, partial [Rhizobium ruizarguesonis]
APSYITRHGAPPQVEDLANHRIITFGEPAPSYLLAVNWLEVAGRSYDTKRIQHLQINSRTSIKRAALLGIGVACLP